jgi:hypothetical protein
MREESGRAFCHFHGDRPAVGVCMRCRRVICAACCTRQDGINYCHACLKALSEASEPPGTPAGMRWLTAGVLMTVGFTVLLLLGWLGQGALVGLDR